MPVSGSVNIRSFDVPTAGSSRSESPRLAGAKRSHARASWRGTGRDPQRALDRRDPRHGDGLHVDTVGSIKDRWRDDHVAFLLGCSLSFDLAMIEAGIPLRHLQQPDGRISV